jgi:hypothetical protein
LINWLLELSFFGKAQRLLRKTRYGRQKRRPRIRLAYRGFSTRRRPKHAHHH